MLVRTLVLLVLVSADKGRDLARWGSLAAAVGSRPGHVMVVVIEVAVCAGQRAWCQEDVDSQHLPQHGLLCGIGTKAFC